MKQKEILTTIFSFVVLVSALLMIFIFKWTPTISIIISLILGGVAVVGYIILLGKTSKSK